MTYFKTAEAAAQPLRTTGYQYSHSTDKSGNVVEMKDPAARNHLFEHASQPERKVTYHEGRYYNVPANTSLVTSLIEEHLDESRIDQESRHEARKSGVPIAAAQASPNMTKLNYKMQSSLTRGRNTKSPEGKEWQVSKKTRPNIKEDNPPNLPKPEALNAWGQDAKTAKAVRKQLRQAKKFRSR